MWTYTAFFILVFICCVKSEIDMVSTYEAFTLDGQRCLGDCGKVFWQYKCMTDWYAFYKIAACKPNDHGVPTLHRISLDGSQCLSDCDKFGNYESEWCSTSKYHDIYHTWDKCSRRLALIGHVTHNTGDEYTTCLNECSDHGDSRNTYCKTFTGLRNWQYCDPADMTHVFDNPTESGKTCVTRCKAYSSGKTYCYNADGDWEKCYMNPPPQRSDFVDISRSVRQDCFKSISDNDKLIWCDLDKKRTRRDPQNELRFQCDVDVSDVLANYARRFPETVIRPFDPNNPIRNDPNPILSYRVIPTLSYFNSNPPEVDLPLTVEAVITSYTVAAPRQPFNTAVDRNYLNMDVNHYHAGGNFDERGHIIAARLGGPTTPYNIFPQPRVANHGARSLWYAMEAAIEAFINGNPSSRYVRIWAALSYPVDGNEVLVHRPDAIMMRVRAYDGNQLRDVFTHQPPYNNVNPYENVFFSNDPDHTCTPLPDQPPSRRRRA